jgi:hypothetical protein
VLAPSAWAFRNSKVPETGPDRGELRHLDFELGDDAMAATDAINTGMRAGPDPDCVDTKMFRWKVED